MADYTVEPQLSDSDGDYTKEAEALTANLSTWWFMGSEAAMLSPEIGPQLTTTRRCSTFHELQDTLATLGPGDDVVELRGGVSRVTTTCIRRHLQRDGNFDVGFEFASRSSTVPSLPR